MLEAERYRYLRFNEALGAVAGAISGDRGHWPLGHRRAGCVRMGIAVLGLAAAPAVSAAEPEAAPAVSAAGPEAAPAVSAAGPEAAPAVSAAGPEAAPAVSAAGPETAPAVSAAEPNAASCIADHADGQVLTRSGKFLQARATFQRCISASCPVPVQNDCRQYAWTVEQLTPTLRLALTGSDGRYTSTSRIELDGAPLPIARWGEPISVNPGPHELRFVGDDRRSTKLQLFAKIGEKGRLVVARLPAPVAALPRPEPTEIVAAGLGVLGLGLFVGFGLSGYSLQQDLEKCAPYCQNHEQAERMRSRYLVADISLAVGLIAIGTASYSYVKRLRASPAAASTEELRGSNRRAQVLLPTEF